MLAVVACACVAASVTRSAALVVLCGVAFVVVSAKSLLIGVVVANGIAVGWLVRAGWREHRLASQARACPEIADALAVGMSSGLPLSEALDAVRPMAGGALERWLAGMSQSLQMGSPVRVAMAQWRASAPVDPEARLLLAAIELGTMHPTHRARAMRDTAASLRLRRLRREDVATQAAQARASSLLIVWSPWVVLILAAIVDPAQMSRLLGSELGRWCLAGAGSLSLLGAFTMRALIQRSGLT